MATSLQTLMIPLLSSIALLFAMLANAQPRPRPPPRRTSFNYDFSRERPRDLTYQGDARFPPQTTFLRLTKTDETGNTALQSSTGRVLYSRPVAFSDIRRQAEFDTTLRFIIRPNNGDTNPADGLAFFIAPVNSTIGDGGGSFGIFDPSGRNPSAFAVEFDIFSNEFDPSYRHVGIDIQSRISSNTTEVDDAILGQQVAARINYDVPTRLIRVNVTAGSKAFEVSYVYDLSTILPPQVQVGIAATTGGLVAVHDVVAWSFRSALRIRRPSNGDHI